MPSTKRSIEGWSERLAAAKKRKPGSLTYLAAGKKYPVKAGDCMSFRAAYSRAKQQGRADVAAKALAGAKRLGCEWATKHSKEEK
jgi:hypothetical protein